MGLLTVAGIYGLLGIVTVVVVGLLSALIVLKTGTTKGLRDPAVVVRALRAPTVVRRRRRT